ncbi:flagellar motor switch protein FliG [Aliifodinibius salipaludis]|uniref:Flagellar motor switch protein FliG n=1 Tax=Fodinibius salipaludis TaxID=2032627 RepID=A0A2A2GCQ0_9BACT|nr:flagellar motor switch protein FliG [Aliifodinibius salipaludis]PAU94625.1 flagellar motor switch protein FliG [Aliifodinibius salipaludis]
MAQQNKKRVISKVDQLTGAEKAAIFITNLGTKNATPLFKYLKEEEIEAVTLAIAGMDNIKPNVVDSIMSEYYRMMSNDELLLEGGQDYANELLEELGDDIDSEKVRQKLKANSENTAFADFQESKITQITNFLKNEHPQVIALIFSQLDEKRTAEILGHLDGDLQAEVIYRLTTMEKISTEVIEEIEEVIKEQMGGMYTVGDRIKSGTNAVAQILNEAEIAVERHILGKIEERDAQMADDIKQQMFLFEDILYFNDRTVQTIINEMEKTDLVMGLKGVDEQVKKKFLENMSDRAGAMLQEDMDALGPVPLKDVKEAQSRIIRKIKQLEEEGQITTRKMGEEEIVE